MTADHAAARAAARARHPAARSWAPDRTAVVRRLAERARARGAPWPRVAAAVIMLRGITGDNRDAFARRVGVSPAALGELEAGRAGPRAVPQRLRSVRHLVDWSWVDADGGRGAGQGLR